MNDNNYTTILPKRSLKTRSYKIDMEKKDLKKLTKGQLIKLLMDQRKNEEVESVKKPTPPLKTGKWESVNPKPFYEKALMKTSYYHRQNNSEMGTVQFQNQGLSDHFKCKKHEELQNLLEKHHYLQHQRTISISMMTYSKLKTKTLKNSKSFAYKAGEIRNSKATQTNSKLKSLKSWTTLKRYITYSKN